MPGAFGAGHLFNCYKPMYYSNMVLKHSKALYPAPYKGDGRKLGYRKDCPNLDQAPLHEHRGNAC